MGMHEQANRVRRDVYPDAAWQAVKLAIRQTVARAGGVEAVAAQCRVAHTQAMAALHDADLVKRTEMNAQGAVIIRLATAAQEIGEALSGAATVAGKPNCARSIVSALHEGHEAIRAMKELVAALEAQIGEGNQ